MTFIQFFNRWVESGELNYIFARITDVLFSNPAISIFVGLLIASFVIYMIRIIFWG